MNDYLGALEVLPFLAGRPKDERARACESLEVSGRMALASRDQEQHGVPRRGLAKSLRHFGGDVIAARGDRDALALREGLKGPLDARSDLWARAGSSEPCLADFFEECHGPVADLGRVEVPDGRRCSTRQRVTRLRDGLRDTRGDGKGLGRQGIVFVRGEHVLNPHRAGLDHRLIIEHPQRGRRAAAEHGEVGREARPAARTHHALVHPVHLADVDAQTLDLPRERRLVVESRTRPLNRSNDKSIVRQEAQQTVECLPDDYRRKQRV
jgi:hypothetical protein